MIRHSIHLTSVALMSTLACADATTAPAFPCAARNVVGDSLIALRWNALARAMVAKYRTDPSARPYALLSMAQHNAATAAEQERNKPCPSVRAAVASASAAVLSSLYPTETAALEAVVRAQIAADETRAATGLSEGEALGRRAAQPILTLAQNDRLNDPFTGTIPTAPGYWKVGSTPPATPMLGKMRPYFLSSGNEFRPAAPPAFGSSAYQAALAEVKQIAAGRTAQQTALATQWAMSGGTPRTQGLWNTVASDIITQRGLKEREATRVLALLNSAMNDASIACFDTKYNYWLIRPSQADASITLSISLPNHPSYPSSHSCTSGAGAEVLGTLFSDEKARLDVMADEIGLSRLYAGIHYRFDIDTGIALGRRVARRALEVDKAKGVLSALPQ